MENPDVIPLVYRHAARKGLLDHLSDQGEACMRVTSNSMSPLMLTGDRIVVNELQTERLAKGKIVLVEAGDQWTTHRIVDIIPAGLCTKGDRSTWPDQAAPFSSCVGEVRMIEWIRDGQVYRMSLNDQNWAVVNWLMWKASWLEYRIVFWGCNLEWENYTEKHHQDEDLPARVKILAAVLVRPIQWFTHILIQIKSKGIQWKPLN